MARPERSKATMRAERRAELDEERAFLLRSLTDLEAEHAAGDVDDDDYAALKDRYTARAADVLRELDGAAPGETSRRLASSGSRWTGRRIAWIAGVLAVAGLAGWGVAAWSGQRLPGQSMTGGQDATGDVTALLSQASAAASSGDFATAISTYDAVLATEPDNPEARTYKTWWTVMSTRVSGDEAATAAAADAALPELAAITAEQPDYADAHCFYAVVAGRFASVPDADLSLEQQQLCMSLDPPSDIASIVEQVLGPLASTGDTTAGTTVDTEPAPLPTDLDGLLDAGFTALTTGDFSRAAEAYRGALDLDPGNAEARTYTAWILALGSQGASATAAQVAIEQAVASFEQVIADHPDYADAHCLYAVTAVQLLPDPDVEVGAEQAEACRALDPSADMEGLLEELVDPMVQALDAGS